MSQSTTFFLAPSSSFSLPPSAPLSLLPFSLGTSSTPYTSSSAPISQYFIPRSSASNEIEVVASFRGRRVVGQYISVPDGYKGLILGTSKRPDRGGIEIHSTSTTKIPLTPASSAPSVASTSTSTVADLAEEGEIRRSTRNTLASGVRVRGAGQVALSKPKPRTRVQRATTAVKKRFRLDSDDEDEDGEKPKEEEGSKLMRTPSKRARNTTTTALSTPERLPNRKEGEAESMTPIPEIVIQEATPLKHPLPTPKKRLSRRRASPSPSPVPGPEPSPSAMMKLDMNMNVVEQSKEDQGESQSSSTSNLNDGEKEGGSEAEIMLEGYQNPSASEEVIPSPATEDDPPSFELTLQVKVKDEPTTTTSNQVQADSIIHDYEGPVRVLRPIAGFEGFTLYTPDVPLAGFRKDETESNSIPKDRDQDQDQSVKPEKGETSLDRKSSTATLINEDKSQETKVTKEEEGEDGSGKLRKGWWRTGGAGEGGDEFVRGLGEWLGLNEILHQPVYLDDLPAVDSDDE